MDAAPTSTAFAPIAGLLAIALSAPALAEPAFTLTSGADFGRGDYGEPVSTRSLALPLSLKIEQGDLTLRASIPYLTTEGTTNPDVGAPVSAALMRQSGMGDLTVAGAYTVFATDAGDVGIDVGVKAKLPTADKDKELLTTGKADFSVQVEAYKASGPVTVFATLGWTKKGEPAGVRFRDPLFYSVGMSAKVAAATSAGWSLDYREKVVRHGDALAEATLFLTHRLSPAWKTQLYLVRGFTDAAADAGGGVTLSYSF